MAQVKMDTDQVRQFGNDLKGKWVTELRSISSTIKSQSTELQWEGIDAQQFKGDRTQQLVQQIDQLCQTLEQLGTTAVNNADRQDDTSNQV